MHASERAEESSHPHSGVILRHVVSTHAVDAYDTDDEVTLRAIPMPMIMTQARLMLLCIACALAGAGMVLAAVWIR